MMSEPIFTEPDSPDGSTLMISVFREDDGRFAAEWQSGGEAGWGGYSATPIGALAELIMTLLKVEEDRVLDGERLKFAVPLRERAAPPVSEGWQPIDQALHDKTEYLLLGPESIDIGMWQDEIPDGVESGVVTEPGSDAGWYGCRGMWPGGEQPTHFMRMESLPAPPAGDPEKAEE